MLTEAGARIEGPASEVLGVVFSTLALSLAADDGKPLPEAERLAMKLIVRVEAKLAAAGYVVRQIEGGQ